MSIHRRPILFGVRAAVFIFTAIAFSVGCHGWTARDTALELAAQASLAADYAQTDQAMSSPAFTENNDIIRATSPAFYFAIASVVHVAIAAALPRGWLRSAFQAASTGWEVSNVTENYLVMHGVITSYPTSVAP